MVACEYCGEQFAVAITGYCTNCHQVREADEQGCCKVCNREIIDSRIESRFIEEANTPVTQPVETATALASTRLRSNRMWIWGIGILIVLGIIALGIGVGPKLPPVVPTNTSTPSLTATLTPSVTPTSTQTPRPTRTPIPAWVNGFVQPILKSIQGREPDMQDNFNGAQRWLFHTNLERPENGSLDLQGRSLLMSIISPAAEDGIGFTTNSNLLHNSFVLQVDADLTQLGSQGALEIDWRGNEQEVGLVLSLWKDGRWQVTFCGSCSPNLMQGHARLTTATRVPITIISRGTEYALLLDNVPVGYIDDVGRRPARRIQLSLWVDNGGHTSLVKYSNLKVWDISKLSIP